jgi:hypothetical protein
MTTGEEFTFEEPPMLAREREAQRQAQATAAKLDRFLAVLRERTGEWALVPDDLVDSLRRPPGPGQRSDWPSSPGHVEAVVGAEAVGVMRVDLVCDQRPAEQTADSNQFVFHARHMFDIPPFEGLPTEDATRSATVGDGG